MKIYLATWMLEPAQATALTQVKGKTRLISYHHTKDFSFDQVQTYCKTGLVKSRKREARE
jgi:hypothetical protein